VKRLITWSIKDVTCAINDKSNIMIFEIFIVRDTCKFDVVKKRNKTKQNKAK